MSQQEGPPGTFTKEEKFELQFELSRYKISGEYGILKKELKTKIRNFVRKCLEGGSPVCVIKFTKQKDGNYEIRSYNLRPNLVPMPKDIDGFSPEFSAEDIATTDSERSSSTGLEKNIMRASKKCIAHHKSFGIIRFVKQAEGTDEYEIECYFDEARRRL